MSVITERQYEEALRDWLGDRAVFHPRWRTMDSAGGFNPHGMLHHWTAMPTIGPRAVSAAAQATRLQYNGSLGLSAHLSPARDGRVFIIAGPHANANHAGNGDPDVWAKVLAGKFDGTPAPRRDVVDGNEGLYGLEYQYHPEDGVMPDEQVEGGILAAAALSEAHGWTPDGAAGSQLDHYEWTSRKWDREVQDLANRTREGVRLALTHRRTAQEDDMANYRDWSKEDKKALAEDVARVTVNKLLRHDLLGGKQELRVSQALRQGSHADDVRRAVEALEAALDKVEGQDGDASPRP